MKKQVQCPKCGFVFEADTVSIEESDKMTLEERRASLQNRSVTCPGCKKRFCGQECQVWSRVVGYHRPIKNWNKGKQSEFKNRKAYGLLHSTKPMTERSGVKTGVKPV